jgi:Domain of unknown function (DUF4338)
MKSPLPTFCGQPLSPTQLELIRHCVARYPGLSREELAATVCEWLDWRRANGGLKTRECRDLLLQLQEPLPALRAGRPRGAATAIPDTLQGEAQAPLHCALGGVQPVRLQRMEQPDELRGWRELVGRYHYLGYRTAYGASLRYLIEASGPQACVLGCLQFSSPAWRMKSRDNWIGWDEVHRQQHLPRLINNSRFLILPWVRIPHLASHVLALSLRTVADDWEQHYGLRPWLAETLVDSSRFAGHCYRAANWIDVGVTTGRGRQDREHQRHGTAPKRVLLYPLRPDARHRLLSDSK